MAGCAVGKLRSRNLVGVIRINLASCCLTVETAKKAQGMTILYIPEEVEKKSTLCRNRTSTRKPIPSSPIAHSLHFGRDLVQSAHVPRRFRICHGHGRGCRPYGIAGYASPASPGYGDPP